MSLRRILLVSEPGKDGVFDYVFSLVAHFRRCHPEIIVDLAYSSRRSGPSLQKLVDAVRAQGGEAVDLNIGHAPQPGDVRAVSKILRLVRQHRPDVIHAHSSKAGALCRILRFLVPGFPPVVYTPHAYFGLSGKKSLGSWVFNTLESLFGRVGFTVNSSSDERNFGIKQLRLSPRRLVLINNGIDLDRFHPASPENRQKYRLEFGFPQEATIIVSVGRDSIQKNYPPLYQTMDRILSDPDSSVFFAHAGAGSDGLGRFLSSAARERWRAYSHLDQVERLLFAADAFVLTSRYEGLSLGALQALGTGLKTFLSRVTGNVCLERIGFTDISWIQSSEDEGEMSRNIERSLRYWLVDLTPPSGRQVARAGNSISNRIQLEKIYRLYTHLVKKSRI